MIVLYLFIVMWCFCGHIIAMAALCFLDKTPSVTKILVSMIAGPLALNKAWWLSNAK